MTHKRSLTFCILILILSSIFVWQFAAATSRKELLQQFCLNNQATNGGFKEVAGSSTDDVTLFTSYANLFILYQIDPDLAMITDLANVRAYFTDGLAAFVQANAGILSDLAYSYQGSRLAAATINSTLIDLMSQKIFEYENDSTSGFGNKYAQEANLADTYYVLDVLNSSNNLALINENEVTAFILACWDAENQGFGGSPNATANPIDTFHGVMGLFRMNQLATLDSEQKTGIASYLNSFYIHDTALTDHYGGYALSPLLEQSSLLMTYYCVKTLEVLDNPEMLHEQTLTWLLSRQNPNDYGFFDVPSSYTVTTFNSSAKLSYYAVNAILTFEPNAFGTRNNALMNEELWNLKTNPWAIAGIVVGSLGIIAIGILLLYRYKNRY